MKVTGKSCSYFSKDLLHCRAEKKNFPRRLLWSFGRIQKIIHLKALFQGFPLNQGERFLWLKFVLDQDHKRSPWSSSLFDLRFASHNPAAPALQPEHELAAPWSRLALAFGKMRIFPGLCFVHLDFLQPSSSSQDLGGKCKKKVDVRKGSWWALEVCFPPQQAGRMRAQGWELPAAPASFP